MANFPTSVPSFANRSAGQTIQSAHINAIQDEVVAIGGGYIQGTAPLNSSNSTCANLSVTGPATFSAAVAFGSALTPATLSTGDTTDYNPSGFSSAFGVRITGNSSGSTLLSAVAPVAGGTLKAFFNVGAVAVGFRHDTGATVANRFVMKSNNDTSVPNNGSIWFWYDATSLRWRQL
jgi:hypothetical protein